MKIGIYSVPDIEPQRALTFAKDIYDFPNHKMTKDAFSNKTGVSMKGGWFGMIIRGMRTYGLVEEKGDVLSTTELMAKLLYPKPGTTELQDARTKVFNSVPLWKKLYSDGLRKTEVEKGDFWVYLSDLDGIRGLDREKVKNKASLVRKGYILALYYLEGAEEPISPKTPKPPTKLIRIKSDARVIGAGRSDSSNETEPKGENRVTEQLKIQKGGLYLEILQDDKQIENMEYAKDLLDFMIRKSRKKTLHHSHFHNRGMTVRGASCPYLRPRRFPNANYAWIA